MTIQRASEMNAGQMEAGIEDWNPGEKKRMSRRKFLGGMGSALAAGSLAYSGLSKMGVQSAAAQGDFFNGEQPNIILIITDQERYPQRWPEGWAEANLPAHQRLKENGLSFKRHFCSAAMCSPSRSTLFTGLHPAQHGVVNTLTEGGTFSPQEPTLPQNIQTMGKMLGAAGYEVIHKGKWHMSKGDDGGDPSSEQVAAYGFDGWEPTSVANDTKVSNFGGGCADWDRKITDQAIDYLSDKSADDETPFLLSVCLGNPHDVLSYSTSWDSCQDDGDGECCNYKGFDFDRGISAPLTVYEPLHNKPTCQAQLRNAANLKLGLVITPLEISNYVNFYAGLTQLVDEQVGRLLDGIPDEIMENTVIIYTSDHGEMGMSHGTMRQKAFNMYEETVNVPLIIHNAQLFPQATETESYAALIDLMPTLATLAQVPDKDNYIFKGQDLTPLFIDPNDRVQNEILFTFDDIYSANPDGPIINPITDEEIPGQPKSIRAIFTDDNDGHWKYARYFDQFDNEPPQFEMYHLRNGIGGPVDPFEIDNLANENSPRYTDPDVVAKREELAQRLQILEDKQLQPLDDGNSSYMPFIING